MPLSLSYFLRHAGRLALLCLACSFLAVRPAAAQRFHFQAYNGSDGLSQETVQCVLQDRSGYLWVGTTSGLNRFDGSQFQRYSIRDGLPGQHIHDIEQDASGRLWIATSGGLASTLDGVHFETYVIHPRQPHAAIQDIAIGADDAVWLVIQSQLYRFRGAQLKLIQLPHSDSKFRITDLLIDQRGQLWVASNAGVFRETPQGFATVARQFLDQTRVDALAQDAKGWIWMATDDGLLAVANNQKTAHLPADELAIEGRIDALTIGQDGTIWIATHAGGLSSIEADRITHIASKNGNPLADIRSIVVDHEGGVWIGGYGGLAHLTSRAFANYTEEEGLAGNFVRPIVRDTHGDLWVGTMSGLSRLRDGNWSSYSTKDGLAGNIIHALLAHSDGSLWVASSHGIDRRVEGRWERLVDSSRDIGSLAESAGGGVYYVSENKAVYEYLDGRSSRIDVGDQVIGRSRLLIDARSQLWLTGERGLARRGSDGSWTRWTTQHGLASNSVYFLTEDHSGNIWFGYHSAHGVTRFDGREFRSWTTADGLHNDSVYSLGVDAENNIWLGTARGVDRFDGRFFTNFATDEGYAHHESNAGGFLANPDGTLYFGTAGGVSHYDPRYAQDLRRAPRVRIEEIRLGGRHFNPNEPIHADADEDDLFVRVSTDSFAPAARQELRYRLLGYDEGWGDMTGDVIAFASLPNSSYVLELQARKYAGPWSAASHVSFQVHRPFYRTLWFASLFVVAILGLACVLLASKLRRNNAPQTPELRAQKYDDELEASEALIELREALARPLQFLQSHSANILAENPNPKTQRSALDVRDVATHIQQLVDGAIELEHGHHSTPPVAKEFKLRRLLKSVFYTAADTARRRGIDTQYTIDGSVPDLARGNGEQLQILLSLLLHEAVKASDGEHISIAANYDVRDEQLRIDILAGASTEGVGIRAAKLHALNLGGELVVDADAQSNASYRFTLPLSCPRPVTL